MKKDRFFQNFTLGVLRNTVNEVILRNYVHRHVRHPKSKQYCKQVYLKTLPTIKHIFKESLQ